MPERSEGRASGHAGRGARGQRCLAGLWDGATSEPRSADGRSGLCRHHRQPKFAR